MPFPRLAAGTAAFILVVLVALRREPAPRGRRTTDTARALNPCR